MKKIILPLAILVICVLCNAQNGATIHFQTKVHEFGQISEKDRTASYDFIFKNTGNGPLVIHKAVASCGCTTPVYPKEPIAAGASASIKVTYNTIGRPGAFHKTITVYTNDKDSPNVVLIIKGNVTPQNTSPEASYPKNMQGLRLKRTLVSIPDVKTGNVHTETIEMINTNTTPVNISFHKLPKYIQATASSPTLKAGETGVLTIKYTPLAMDLGKKEDSFYLVTNPKDKENPDNKINVSAFITEDFSGLSAGQRQNAPIATFSENRVNFGTMAAGTRKTVAISLTNEGKSPLLIRKIVPEYDGIKVVPEKRDIQAGKTIKVNIGFNAGTFNGNVVQRISFFTNDPRNSINRIFLTALVTDKK